MGVQSKKMVQKTVITLGECDIAKEKQMYEVYGVESGEIQYFPNYRKAMAFIKDVQRFDKENGLDGEEWRIVKL